MTYADVSWYENLTALTSPSSPTFQKRMPWFDADARAAMMDNLPLLRALVKRVEEEQPGIAKWVHEQRPKNEEEPF